MNPLYRNDRQGQFPQSWYATTVETPPPRAALKGAHRADVCVIGAGYTGLTAALELAQKGFSVIVLEAHRAGFGASGRNGGQVSSGYNWDPDTLASKLGDETARALWDAAEEAKADLRARVATHAPDARYTPGVAYGVYTEKAYAKLQRSTEYIVKTYGYDDLSALDATAFQDIVRSPLYAGGTLDMGAGHIHPLRYVLGLASAAEDAGAQIFEGSEVHHIAHGTPVTLRTRYGHVTADHVIIAGNGYLPNIARPVAAKVMPINSFICATAPLGDRAAEVLARDIAVADSRFVVNYYRLSEDGRLLFGGRAAPTLGFPNDIAAPLVARMGALFPQIKGVGIDYAWGGTLGITLTRLPALQRIAPNVLAAGGFSGHGVALSGFSGKVMAAAIAGQAEKFDVMTQLPTPNFPGGTAFRAPLLMLAMTWYGLRDRLGL